MNAERLLDGPEIFVGDSEERCQPGVGKGDCLVGVGNLRLSLKAKTYHARAGLVGRPGPRITKLLECKWLRGPVRRHFPLAIDLAQSSRPFSTASRMVDPLALCRASPTTLPPAFIKSSSPTPGLAAQPPQYRAAPRGSQALNTLPSISMSPPDLTTLKP